jgi:hypothetical protein
MDYRDLPLDPAFHNTSTTMQAKTIPSNFNLIFVRAGLSGLGGKPGMGGERH